MRNKLIIFLLSTILVINSFVPLIQTPLAPKPAYAQDNACAASSAIQVNHKSRTGAASLEQAAKYLTQISDITGA